LPAERGGICIRQKSIAEIHLTGSQAVAAPLISSGYKTFHFGHFKVDNGCLLSFGHPYC
jgi:hypothetical protein